MKAVLQKPLELENLENINLENAKSLTNPQNSRQKGRECEQRVTDYLATHDYVILERNFSCRVGEVDIIGLKDDILCFVEVKSLPLGWPLEDISKMVDFQKQKRIKLTATEYLNTVDLSGRFACIRFDVATVSGAEVSYIEGAF